MMVMAMISCNDADYFFVTAQFSMALRSQQQAVGSVAMLTLKVNPRLEGMGVEE